MTVEAADSADEAAEYTFGESDGKDLATSSWHGRELEYIAILVVRKHLRLLQLSQFYLSALQRKEGIDTVRVRPRHCEPLALTSSVRREVPLNFPPQTSFLQTLHRPSNREFALADLTSTTAEVLECRNLVKTAWKKTKRVCKETGKGFKKVGKGLEKAGREVKHAVEKTVDYVADHKKEVLIVAAATAVAVAGYYLVPVIAGALAGGSEAANRKREDEDENTSGSPETLPPPTDVPSSETASLLASATPDGISQVDSVSSIKSPFQTFLEMQQQQELSRAPTAPSISAIPPRLTKPVSPPTRSCHVETEGVTRPGIGIGLIPGMNTSFEGSMSHLNHIKNFAGEVKVEGVYNHSNTGAGDFLEIISLNYLGVAPVTGALLLENWTKFHEANRDNPHAKYLQFTHSMGTILTRNALLMAPHEIRDRVIVVAIGPAAIIPEGLCFDSIHYASENDLVHYGEVIHTLLLAGVNTESQQTELFQAQLLQQLWENRDRLVLLPPHPEATGLDHDFESPTFEKQIARHVQEYLNSNGQYK